MISLGLIGLYSTPGKRSRKAELLIFPGDRPSEVRLIVRRRRGATPHMVEVDRADLLRALEIAPHATEGR